MTELPAPLTPSECDLRDFRFMPLEVDRLRRSKAWLLAKRNPALGFYMFNLWASSWHEVPCASLEDDDDMLAEFAMCDPKKWAAVREKVLRGWVKCSDGRLYHPVVAEKANESWAAKTKQRSRTAAATQARRKVSEDRNDDRNGERECNRDGDRNGQRNDDRNDNVTITKGQGQGQGRDRDEKGFSLRSPGNDPPPKPIFPDWWPHEAWNGYLAMRKKAKKSPTEHAVELAIAELTKLRADGEDPKAVLDQSTMRHYTGLFPVKAKNDGAKPPSADTARSPEDQFRADVDLFKKRGIWPAPKGPPPNDPDCQVPKNILAEFGYGAAH